MSSEKFGPIETKYIKGVAVVLMLYHHLYGFPEKLPSNITGFFLFPDICNFMANFGNICVSIFLFLAGYAAYLKLIKTNNPWSHVKSSILSVYKLYWIVFFIFTPLSILLGKAEFNLIDFILGAAGLKFSYNAEAWFIFIYTICTLASPWVVSCVKRLDSKKKFIYIIIIMRIFTAIISSLYSPANKIFGEGLICEMINVLARIEIYILGVIFAKLDLINKLIASKHFQEKRYFWVVVPLTGIIWLNLIRMNTNAHFIIYNVEPFLCVIIVVFLLAVQKYIPAIKRFFVAIGKESTVMWLVHTYLCARIAIDWTYSFKFDLAVLWVLVAETYCISKGIKFFLNRGYKK